MIGAKLVKLVELVELGERDEGHEESFDRLLTLAQTRDVEAKHPSTRREIDLSPAHSALREVGYEASVIEDVGSELPLSIFRQRLISRFRSHCSNAGDLLGVYRCVGSAGVGKTKTLMQLLVSWSEFHDLGHVLVVDTHSSRLGAGNSLSTCCSLLGVNYVQTPEVELYTTLANNYSLHKPALVLIDSSPMSNGPSTMHPRKDKSMKGTSDTLNSQG